MKSRSQLVSVSFGRILLTVAVLAGLTAGAVQPVAAATTIDIVGPPGSGAFGTSVTALPGGNIVVTDPYFDAGAISDVGAVYLYDGATGALISDLTGSTAGDQVGSGGVKVLSNGNYLVRSPNWDNGAAAGAGAVTWGSGTAGVSGVVSAANSLVGSSAGDRVGCADDSCTNGMTVLSNGNYLVVSPDWDNGAAADAGAVTWGNGMTGIDGPVSAGNSLVGNAANDRVGCAGDSCYRGVVILSNGNYLVVSPDWSNGVAEAGAVTWGSATVGIAGPVSAANSLVGSTAGDGVGWGVTALNNGNYVVVGPYWDNGATADVGAVTWGNGTTGISGPVSAANSLVGSTAGDGVGWGVTALNNGNYVVGSSDWDYGAIVDAGASTWGNGTTGISGPVSAANSLVGNRAEDRVGYGHAIALSNGNYLVRSPYWDRGAATDAGAVTWGNGTTGISGPVSAANSLVGSSAGDEIGRLWPLSNGNYVVTSSVWDNGAAWDAGAATWGNGMTGIAGPVSAANSLVGTKVEDLVGRGGAVALSNGNYVVRSHNWRNGTAIGAGAVTWGSGTSGIHGPVSAANSLVGSTARDFVGLYVVALSNGNYVVWSPYWDNGGLSDIGAATWGNGMAGIRGLVSVGNSLVGSTAGDGARDGVSDGGGVTALSNGNYVVRRPYWDNGAVVDVGAATWGNGTTGIIGPVSVDNSLVGSTAGDRIGCIDYSCYKGVTALSNGNYVVRSINWDNGAATDAGAVTWGNGKTGTSGVVSEANSLVGSSTSDQVSDAAALSNGNYVVHSINWDNGASVNAGAVTWGSGVTGVAGPIMAENSVRGTAENGGGSMRWAYDGANRQLVVGRPADNIVTLFRLPPVYPALLPVILKNSP